MNEYRNFDNMPYDFSYGRQSTFPENPSYGQSYVPIQMMNKTFKLDVGLKMGTIFPELVSPYEPCQSMRQIEYLESFNHNQEVGVG